MPLYLDLLIFSHTCQHTDHHHIATTQPPRTQPPSRPQSEKVVRTQHPATRACRRPDIAATHALRQRTQHQGLLSLSQRSERPASSVGTPLAAIIPLPSASNDT